MFQEWHLLHKLSHTLWQLFCNLQFLQENFQILRNQTLNFDHQWALIHKSSNIPFFCSVPWESWYTFAYKHYSGIVSRAYWKFNHFFRNSLNILKPLHICLEFIIHLDILQVSFLRIVWLLHNPSFREVNLDSQWLKQFPYQNCLLSSTVSPYYLISYFHII